MKEMFADIYNKVLNFFQPSKEDAQNTKETACNRLKLVLMQDRVHMDPFIMQKMREEMIELLNKYLEIDNEALDLNLAGEGESIALMFNIPVIRAKSNEEIEEYEKALKEKLTQESEEQENNKEMTEETSDDVSENAKNEDVSEENNSETIQEENISEVLEEENNNIEETEQAEEVKEEPVKKKSSKKSEN